MNIRLAYDSHRAVSIATGLKCLDKSLTLQSQAVDADINVIMKRFGVSGVLPQVALPPTYGDFGSVMEYRDALDLIREADRSFAKMPADVRRRFNNDAAEFVEFCDNPDNLPEMRKLGLAVPEPVVAAVVTEPKAT